MTYIPTVHVASSCTLQDIDIAVAYRLAADHLYGKDGTFLYLAFDHINATYFDGVLPEALILWDITEWGRCLGWCRSPHDGPPIIKIHPSTVHPRTFDCIKTSDGWLSIGPWRIPSAEIGYCYAYDVLLHECIHASVEYLRGGWMNSLGVTSNWTSHNNPVWVGECNRIGRLLGYHDIGIQMSKSKRVPNPDPNGSKTVVRRVNEGTSKPEHFPHNLDTRACFHRKNQLPFEFQA